MKNKALIVSGLILLALVSAFFIFQNSPNEEIKQDNEIWFSETERPISKDSYTKIESSKIDSNLSKILLENINSHIDTSNMKVRYAQNYNYDGSSLVFIDCKNDIDFSEKEELVNKIALDMNDNFNSVDIHVCSWSGWTIEDGIANMLLY